MSDLERLGRNVGGQWEIEFYLMLDRLRIRVFAEPPRFDSPAIDPPCRYVWHICARDWPPLMNAAS